MLDERISTCDQQLKEGQNRKAQQGIPDTELPDFLERQAVKAPEVVHVSQNARTPYLAGVRALLQGHRARSGPSLTRRSREHSNHPAISDGLEPVVADGRVGDIAEALLGRKMRIERNLLGDLVAFDVQGKLGVPLR